MSNKLIIYGVALSVALVLATDASAHGGYRGGHGGGGPRVGLYFGAPLAMGGFGYAYGYPYYGGYPYYPAYAYPPAPIVVQQPQPQIYVEQQQPAQPQMQAPIAPPVWYYCPAPGGYYPYVSKCSKPWVPVDPSTVPQASPTVPPDDSAPKR